MPTTSRHRRSRDLFIGRQLILDHRHRAIGYELLSRSGREDTSNIEDGAKATATVMQRAFREIGIQTIVGGGKAFINVDAEMLLSPMLESLAPDRVVLELLESIVIDEQVVRRSRELKAKGYRLALDDFVHYDESYTPLLEIVDVVKIDILQLDRTALTRLVQRLRLWPPKLLAEKVDSADRARHCRALGFDLFQGFFFGTPGLAA